jgi:hypothetical protein
VRIGGDFDLLALRRCRPAENRFDALPASMAMRTLNVDGGKHML